LSAGVQLDLGLVQPLVSRYVGKTVDQSITDHTDHTDHTDLPSYRLTERLRSFGLPTGIPVYTHANRRILVSLTVRGALRVHAGYAMAPDEVIAAIARWARPRVTRADRRAAQRMLTGFPVHQHVPPSREARRRTEPPRPGDERTLARLRELHRELNARHFAGGLGPVILVLASRMRRRLGEFRQEDPGAAGGGEIRISRRHLRRDGWRGVAETLAHEMVHQWQAESGRKLAHDAAFRKRCAAMGIDPGATRRLDNDLFRSS
jgi:hypothetical protein